MPVPYYHVQYQIKPYLSCCLIVIYISYKLGFIVILGFLEVCRVSASTWLGSTVGSSAAAGGASASAFMYNHLCCPPMTP